MSCRSLRYECPPSFTSRETEAYGDEMTCSSQRKRTVDHWGMSTLPLGHNESCPAHSFQLYIYQMPKWSNIAILKQGWAHSRDESWEQHWACAHHCSKKTTAPHFQETVHAEWEHMGEVCFMLALQVQHGDGKDMSSVHMKPSHITYMWENKNIHVTHWENRWGWGKRGYMKTPQRYTLNKCKLITPSFQRQKNWLTHQLKPFRNLNHCLSCTNFWMWAWKNWKCL